MSDKNSKIYILLISIHGLIRGYDLELGKDADTGGQTKYVLELAQALSRHELIGKVDLVTRKIVDPGVDESYAVPLEPLNEKASIVRIECGPNEYIQKEQLWDYLDNFSDNLFLYLKEQDQVPQIVHSHYADAGYVGIRISNLLNIPLIHTGHSLGRTKRTRLLAAGIKPETIESRYKMSRRIDTEEDILATASRIINSTHQETRKQYGLYHFYQPEKMQVIPPGTDLSRFTPPDGREWSSAIAKEIGKFLRNPQKPMILAISRPDQRKNIHTLIEAYGKSTPLQELANLVIVAGNRDDILDLDEGAEEVIKNIILTVDLYDLYGKVAYPKKHNPEDVPILYKLASLSGGVFVNPALTEPFGLTLLEAAASGLPILATDDGGPVDIIGNCRNGYLINPLDTEDIGRKLVKILKDRNVWKTLKENGLHGVRAHFSWQSHVDRYIAMLKPLTDKSRFDKISPRPMKGLPYRQFALATDIDLNLLGNQKALQELMTILSDNNKKISFWITTGRRMDSALQILRKNAIQMPDVLIASMGTEIYYTPHFNTDVSWRNHIDHLWRRKAIVSLLNNQPGLSLQPKSNQNSFKISYYYDPQKAPSIDEINTMLRENELSATVSLAFGQFLDILPIRASKGYALRWCAAKLDIPLEHFVTVGGSGSDEDMMRGNTLSIVVGNRHHEELSDLKSVEPIYFSKKKYAAGIIEGLNHYKFLAMINDA